MEKGELTLLYEQITKGKLTDVAALVGAGSSRRYYRLVGDAGSIIFTEGDDLAENEAFIYLCNHFSHLGLPVPRLLMADPDKRWYIQQDLGDTSLYSLLSTNKSATMTSLEDAMRALAHFHSVASHGLDFSHCYPVSAMDMQAVMWDLNYFKYCFLKNVVETFSEVKLEEQFRHLASMLTADIEREGRFILRDCQSRNVMIHDGAPYFIDFQGGRKGMPQYDVASFLWQARAGYTPEERSHLIDVYLSESDIKSTEFLSKLQLFVLFRLLQVLGAYGFRGLSQHKAAFVAPLRKAVALLREQLPHIPHTLSYLKELLLQVCEAPMFAQAADDYDGLTVEVISFSYKKGVPIDLSGNGGGFVFDCRAVHNPGRYEQYKRLTGRDEPVIRFLEDDGEILDFLNHVYALVDASVDRYIKRGFRNLQVCFGCTGGQHRSVYSAEAVARHLAERGDLRVCLIHREQNLTFTYPDV